MRFGANSARLTVRRKQPQAGVPGVPFGEYADAFTTWCSWRQARGAEAVTAGQAEDVIQLVTRVGNCAQNRTITGADCATLNGVGFSIATVGLPDRLTGTIELVLKRQDGA